MSVGGIIKGVLWAAGGEECHCTTNLECMRDERGKPPKFFSSSKPTQGFHKSVRWVYLSKQLKKCSLNSVTPFSILPDVSNTILGWNVITSVTALLPLYHHQFNHPSELCWQYYV